MSEYQKNLWAPWRMEYIASLGPNADNGCFLCRAIAAPQADAENHVLWRCPQTLTLLNLFPYSTGHVLVAPTTHVGEPEDLPDAVLLEMMQRARDAKRVLQAQKRVNVDFPTWMIDSLDREASKLGVTRQSVIKVWLAERLEATSSSLSVRRTRAGAAQR